MHTHQSAVSSKSRVTSPAICADSSRERLAFFILVSNGIPIRMHFGNAPEHVVIPLGIQHEADIGWRDFLADDQRWAIQLASQGTKFVWRLGRSRRRDRNADAAEFLHLHHTTPRGCESTWFCVIELLGRRSNRHR